MPVTSLKEKIHLSLNAMNEDELRSAFFILKEIKNGSRSVALNNDEVDANISIGLKQLKNGLGSNFSSFLDDVKTQYGSKK